jgi:hypothetical protein
MKKITIHKIKALLESLGTDESTQELVLNNISQYNAIVSEIQKGEHVNQYLAYQLNVAIGKQIDLCKKNKPVDTGEGVKESQKAFEERLKKPNVN